MSARRCPACDAAAPPSADWCSLCYVDLRPPVAVPVPARIPLARPMGAACTAAPPYDATAGSGGETDAAAGWPCGGCGVVVPLAAGHCAACGTTFLADLRRAGVAVPLPVVGDLLSLSQRQRAVLALGVAAVVLVLGAGAFTVGALLLA